MRAGERGVAGVAARLDTRLRLEADPRLEAGLDSSTVQYSTIQYSTVPYSTIQYSTVQYSTVLF